MREIFPKYIYSGTPVIVLPMRYEIFTRTLKFLDVNFSFNIFNFELDYSLFILSLILENESCLNLHPLHIVINDWMKSKQIYIDFFGRDKKKTRFCPINRYNVD